MDIPPLDHSPNPVTDFGQNRPALWVYSTVGEQACPFATVQKPHAVGGLSFLGGNAPGVAKGSLLLCLWLESSRRPYVSTTQEEHCQALLWKPWVS